MQLKNTYSAREVAALTGLSARQLQWWDARRLFLSAVAPKPTAAAGSPSAAIRRWISSS